MFICICDKKLLEKAFMPDDLCGSEVITGMLDELGREKSLYNRDVCIDMWMYKYMDIF